MAQVNSENSITVPVDTTRRHLLTIAAGGAVAAMAISTTAQAAGSPTAAEAATIDDATRGMSEALALVERCRKGNRRWDVLADKIDSIKEAAKAQYGHRPIALVAWRNYSAIACSEIERARDEFIREGLPANVVQAEYSAAKRRERDLERTGEDWDKKVGLSDLRKEYEANRIETRAAWKALGEVRLTSIRDAVAIIGLLRERMRVFDELSDDWEVAAFMNASRFLVRAAT